MVSVVETSQNSIAAQIAELAPDVEPLLVLGSGEVAKALRTECAPGSVVATDGATTQLPCLVLGERLDRLADPLEALGRARQLLAPDGRLIVVAANLAHGSRRLALVQGHWESQELGFTLESLLSCLSTAGLGATAIRAVLSDVLSGPGVADPEGAPPGLVEWLRFQPLALEAEFVVAAQPGVGSIPVSGLVPAIPRDEVRVFDEFSEQAKALAEQTHSYYLTRDAIIGLEASLARADRELAAAREGAKQDFLQSPSFRVGRMVTAPLRVARRVAR